MAIQRLNLMGVGGASSGLKAQIFDTPGTFTWTKWEGYNFVGVLVIGAGGGGGGSGYYSSTSYRAGVGGGGGSGYMFFDIIDVSSVDEVLVTVGAKGNGGAGGLSTSINAASGSSGGASSFGTYLTADGGTFGHYGTYGSTSAGASGLGGVGLNPGVGRTANVAGAGSGFLFTMFHGTDTAANTALTSSQSGGKGFMIRNKEYGAGGNGNYKNTTGAGLAGDDGTDGCVVIVGW